MSFSKTGGAARLTEMHIQRKQRQQRNRSCEQSQGRVDALDPVLEARGLSFRLGLKIWFLRFNKLK